MIPPGISMGDGYIDGFEVMGDISKKRKKELEVTLSPFQIHKK